MTFDVGKALPAVAKAIEDEHEGLITLAQAKYLMQASFDAGKHEGRISNVRINSPRVPMDFDEWWATLSTTDTATDE